jgi:hypothetical protein
MSSLRRIAIRKTPELVGQLALPQRITTVRVTKWRKIAHRQGGPIQRFSSGANFAANIGCAP